MWDIGQQNTSVFLFSSLFVLTLFCCSNVCFDGINGLTKLIQGCTCNVLCLIVYINENDKYKGKGEHWEKNYLYIILFEGLNFPIDDGNGFTVFEIV